MAKNRLSKLITATLCFALSITCVSAREYLATKQNYFEGKTDFEDFAVGLAADSTQRYDTTNNGSRKLYELWSVDATKGNLKIAIEETEDKNGDSTKALHFYVDGAAKYGDTDVSVFQPRPDNTAWDAATLGKYYVYKLKFKSGGDGKGYFKADPSNWAACATIDWLTGKADFGRSANTEAFALDEWVDFEFVVDRTGDNDIQYMRFNSSIGEKEFVNTLSSRMTIKNSSPRWLSWIHGNASSENPSLWFDDIEMYYTDYNIFCPLNGATGVEPDDKITLSIEGDIDENTLGTISVTGGGETVGISDISLEDGICTINLDEKMKDFTEYTIDYSNVCSETGLKKKMNAATFSTTGKIDFSVEVASEKMNSNVLSAISNIEKGIIRTTFTAENITNVTAENVILCSKLMKDSEIRGMNYQVQNVAYGEKAVLKSAFFVPDDTYTIEMCVKNSVNGTVYYTDIYTFGKNGTVTSAAPEENDFANIAESSATDNTVRFYNITLGENGKSEETTKLKEGLTEAVAKAENGILINVLKKDGAIAALSYHERPQNGSAMHSAIYVPEDGGYTLDTFVWSDIKGTEAYMPKNVISSESEGN